MTDGLQARLDFAIALAREAGAHAIAARGAIGGLEPKRPMDYATRADHEVEALIRARIADRFGDAVIGEEDGGTPASLVWVVDPIDGTVNYIHGTPRWCVSIGLVAEGEPAIGVVYAPDEGRLFAARRGHGATLNGAPVRVSGLCHGASPIVETGWAPRRPFSAYTALLTGLIEANIEFRRLGSGALGMVDAACGRNDGYLELHINPWDVLAGIVLVREAGGWVSDFLGQDGLTRGNPVIACTPEIAERLAAIMNPIEPVPGP